MKASSSREGTGTSFMVAAISWLTWIQPSSCGFLGIGRPGHNAKLMSLSPLTLKTSEQTQKLGS